jgi:hypothetical protein
MNFLRIPLNIFVCVVLYNVSSTFYSLIFFKLLYVVSFDIKLFVLNN